MGRLGGLFITSSKNHRHFKGIGNRQMKPNGWMEENLYEPKQKNWTWIFILFLSILGTYFGSLQNSFINIDDPLYIRANPYIRDLSWDGIYKIFSRPIVGNYFPLQILSYALDYQIWHLHPFGYHLHNVLLHILNAVLVFLLLKKIFADPWVSFLAALFFGLHPVNVESVSWVAERKNVLSMAFLLLSFLSYLYYLGEEKVVRRRVYYLSALFLFLLALLAKVSAVVLPILFLLYDHCFQRKKRWEMIRDKIPFFFLAGLFSMITLWIYHTLHHSPGFHGGSPYTNFLAMINVFVEYIIYLIVPVYLDHSYWSPTPQTIWDGQVLLSIAAISFLSFSAWRSFQKNRIFFFGFVWFIISLLPVLNIFPIAILRADRYMYLPAIGFFYLLSLALTRIGRFKYGYWRLAALLLGPILVAGSFAFLTMERNKLWKDFISLWEENLKKYPQRVEPYRLIGLAHLERGNWDLALSYFQSGLGENPNEVDLLMGLALVHKEKGDLKQAEDWLLKAKEIHPLDSAIYNNLGTIFLQRGEVEKGERYIQKAIEIDPQNYAARTNRGVICYRRNQWDEAILELKKATALYPGAIKPYLNLAVIYHQKGLLRKAESCIKEGLDYFPTSHAGLLMLGRISFEQGKMQEAKEYVSQAHWLKPKDEGTNYFMGLLAQGGDGYSQKATNALPSPQPELMDLPISRNQRLRNP